MKPRGLLGTKIRQTQVFDKNNWRIPVTEIEMQPNKVVVCLEKTAQLGYGEKKIKHLTKPMLGHFKKAGIEKNYPRFLQEIAVEKSAEELKTGEIISLDKVFEVGDKIKITGTSKGKGFAGVVKRHHFHGGPATHGQSDRQRHPGSIGQSTTPGRVYKGKRMAGKMGNERILVKNLEVVEVNSEKGILIVKGLVPGHRGSLLEVEKI